MQILIIPDDWGDRIADYANQPMVGAKQKFRSVFVNENINGRGGFANPKDAATQNNIHFDPNAVGSTFAIDVDGDAIYEREDALLQKLVDLDFDEIALYNVSKILKKGTLTVTSLDVNNSITNQPYDNMMGETQPADWHLARFVSKAKNDYGLRVLAVVPSNKAHTDYEDEFYSFFDVWARSMPYDSNDVENFFMYFITKYQED